MSDMNAFAKKDLAAAAAVYFPEKEVHYVIDHPHSVSMVGRDLGDNPVGHRLARLGRFAWTAHNVFAHPLSEILHHLGMIRASNWVHDITIPLHEREEGRE